MHRPYSTIAPSDCHFLTADELIAQGATAAAVASIATWYRKNGNPAMAQHIRGIVSAMCATTGERLYFPRPAKWRRKKAANNNRPVRYGARRAA